MSVDGVDFKVQRVKRNMKAFKTHKFKESGLRYEIGVCILTGMLFGSWVHSPVVIGMMSLSSGLL